MTRSKVIGLIILFLVILGCGGGGGGVGGGSNATLVGRVLDVKNGGPISPVATVQAAPRPVPVRPALKAKTLAPQPTVLG